MVVLEKVISTDRNLKYVFDTLVSDVLYLKVTDRTSGVSYFGKTNLEITAEYGQNGWVILSEKEGNRVFHSCVNMQIGILLAG